MAQRLALVVVFCAATAASAQGHPVLRHVGRWTEAPKATPTSIQVSVVDGPMIGNGDVGVTTAPHRESYPLSTFSTPANQTFWVGKNDFWSATTITDGTAADLHCQLPYTILSVGGLTVSFASVPSTSSYAATQNLSSARITTSVVSSGGRVLGTEAFVAASSNVLVVSLSSEAKEGGCPADSAEPDEIATVSLWSTKGEVNEPYDQDTCGPGGRMPRHGYTFPTTSGVTTDHLHSSPRGGSTNGLWVTRDSVHSVKNSCVLQKCGPVNEGYQFFQKDALTGQVALTDGRCLKHINGTDRVTVEPCGGVATSQWSLDDGGRLVGKNSGSTDDVCLGAKSSGEELWGGYAFAFNCSSANASNSKWVFDGHGRIVWSPRTSDASAGTMCLTAVDDNRLIRAAQALTAGVGTHVVSWDGSQSDAAASMKVSIGCGRPATLFLAILTSEDSDSGGLTGVVSAAEALAAKAAKNASGLAQDHADWWSEFWNKSWVDLTGGNNDNSLIESYYYGSQYIIGSASRKNKIAPGLFGPWQTGDAAGWNGDYTLNYNFQSPYYGVYSSNRPELALPFFPAINSGIDLAKRRAQKAPWSGGEWGFSGIEIDDYGVTNFHSKTIMPGGYRGVEFPGHLGPFGLHDWTDRGQRSNGLLSATTFIDHVEYTGDADFMKNEAYPFVVLCLDFFENYMVKTNLSADGQDYVWTSPDDCSMERCLGAPGAAEYNPIVTIGCLHRVLSSALEFSEHLGVDVNRRGLWRDILGHLPPPSKTVDVGAGNRTVFAESGKPGSVFGENAWFPLDYFAALHPGSGIGLATSSKETMEIMLNTVEGINRMNGWVPLSGMQMAWIGAIRAGCNGTLFLAQARKILSNRTRFHENFYPNTGGGGLEQAGVTLAVNEMLLQSHEGRLSFFPVWPTATLPASFGGLRTVGAFIVGAHSDPQTGISGVVVESTKGGVLRLLSPWPGCKVLHVVDSSGATQPVKAEGGDIFSLKTASGDVYRISCQ